MVAFDYIEPKKYKLLYPEKYKGNINNVYFRSYFEYDCFQKIEKSSDILEWKSEPIKIEYYHPIQQTIRKYIVDVWVKYSDVINNRKKEALIEIKPLEHIITQSIKIPTIPREKIIYEKIMENKIINDKKFSAALQYCSIHKMNFFILCEHGFFMYDEYISGSLRVFEKISEYSSF